MKRNILFLFLICFAFKLQSQNYTMSLNIRPYESLFFSLDFFGEGKYFLATSHHFYRTSIHSLHPLSYDNYNLVDDTYTLVDEVNQYELSLKVVNVSIRGENETVLKTLQGFGWMKNNFFVLRDQKAGNNRYLFDEVQTTKRDVQYEIEKHQSISEKEFELSIGTYESRNINYTIILNSDNSYSINLYGYPLSVGKWERHRNVLLLNDTSLEKYFTALIRKKGILTSMYLPFEFKKRDFVYTRSSN
ncbi:hypothetical protein PSM36_1331 [Proteiniphilum saccharofermentans]|uniref:Secreted protein n=1 Tax=Proteiniphilum saccharofermentans TaxID=1642647 RepID=A0A1R3T9B9_9BACT|nr:hypothetical protein [Proteiniphilum saccharofermentans]SCD20154.1 hypothetical protein PSM36_1331 [Proteiniphilum saccharofermentans]